MPKKIIKIISVNWQYKQSECLFPPAMCWEYLESCTPPDKLLPLPLYKDPAITLVCWHPEYQYNNASSFSARPPHTHTHKHTLTTLPTQTPHSPPLFPSSNTKLPMVAMATAGVHKSKRRGTLHSLKLSGGFFLGGGGRGAVVVGGGGVIYGT